MGVKGRVARRASLKGDSQGGADRQQSWTAREGRQEGQRKQAGGRLGRLRRNHRSSVLLRERAFGGWQRLGLEGSRAGAGGARSLRGAAFLFVYPGGDGVTEGL